MRRGEVFKAMVVSHWPRALGLMSVRPCVGDTESRIDKYEDAVGVSAVRELSVFVGPSLQLRLYDFFRSSRKAPTRLSCVYATAHELHEHCIAR